MEFINLEFLKTHIYKIALKLGLIQTPACGHLLHLCPYFISEMIMYHFTLSFPPSAPLHIPSLLSVSFIASVFINTVTCTDEYVYTHSLLNRICSVCIMLLIYTFYIFILDNQLLHSFLKKTVFPTSAFHSCCSSLCR